MTDWMRQDHDRQLAAAQTRAAFNAAERALKSKIGDKSLSARELRGCTISEATIDYDSILIVTTGDQFFHASLVREDYSDNHVLERRGLHPHEALKHGIITEDDAKDWKELSAAVDALTADGRKRTELQSIAQRYPELGGAVSHLLAGGK